MREIRMSGLMSGERKRATASRPRTAPFLDSTRTEAEAGINAHGPLAGARGSAKRLSQRGSFLSHDHQEAVVTNSANTRSRKAEPEWARAPSCHSDLTKPCARLVCVE